MCFFHAKNIYRFDRTFVDVDAVVVVVVVVVNVVDVVVADVVDVYVFADVVMVAWTPKNSVQVKSDGM